MNVEDHNLVVQKATAQFSPRVGEKRKGGKMQTHNQKNNLKGYR